MYAAVACAHKRTGRYPARTQLHVGWVRQKHPIIAEQKIHVRLGRVEGHDLADRMKPLYSVLTATRTT